MKDYSRYLAIPYKAGGRDFSGCDCWGLVRLFLLNEFGIEIGNYSEYSIENLEEVKQAVEEGKKEWIKIETPQSGDVVEIQMLKRDFHVGVVAHPGYILHICNESFSEMNKFTHPLINRSIKRKRFWRHNDLSSRQT